MKGGGDGGGTLCSDVTLKKFLIWKQLVRIKKFKGNVYNIRSIFKHCIIFFCKIFEKITKYSLRLIRIKKISENS